MCNNRINQKFLIPLFNVELGEPIKLSIDEDEFVEKLTAFIFPEPIQVYPKIEQKQDNELVPTPLPPPKTTIYFYPWNSQGKIRHEISNILPLDQLPADFDIFDNLGIFAVRAGPGGLGGFQTHTQIKTKRHATTLLIIEFDQIYPNSIQSIVVPSNPYEFNVTESLLDAVRLISGNEPHQYKGYHLSDNQMQDIITKWPLVEIQGQVVKLTATDLEKLKNAFLQVWQIRYNSRKSKSCKILNLALEYYYLSSTMSETRTIFLYLMIAFEALFKTQDDNSASPASARMAKLLAETKAEKKMIGKFVWNKNGTPGCCQIRNQIVHGEVTSLSSDMFWRLRSLLRFAILRISDLILSSQIDRDSYYESLSEYIDNRFTQLPNK